MLSFNQVRNGSLQREKRFSGRLLTLDPGETTGVSFWEVTQEEANLKHIDQIKTWPLEHAVNNFQRLFDEYRPSFVVFESYQVYQWKLDEHSFSDVPTVQVIGCLKTYCIFRGIKYTSQTAQVAKQFCTDDKLDKWGLYHKGQRHARDAIRHGVYFLLFGLKKDS